MLKIVANNLLYKLKEKFLNGKPAILFIRGLEVLEMYYQKEVISLFIAELQMTNDLISNLFIFSIQRILLWIE